MKIKEYCKTHKLRFESDNDDYFIASKIVPINAGMELNNAMNGIESYKIKKVGSKRVFRKFKVYPDGDISDYGIFESKFIH